MPAVACNLAVSRGDIGVLDLVQELADVLYRRDPGNQSMSTDPEKGRGSVVSDTGRES